MRVPKLFLMSLMVGLILSCILAVQQASSNRQHLDSEAAEISDQLASQIQRQMERYQYGLRGARGLILGVGADQVTTEIFQRYSQSRDLKTEFPGARGIGFIRRVSRANLESYIATVRAGGETGFRVHQLQPHSGDHYVIEFIEPQEPNKTALGLDIASEEKRRNAAIESMRTGVAQLTAPITLVQANMKANQSFLLLLPMYKRPSTPATQEGHESELVGWTYTPLHMPEVLTKITVDDQKIEMRLSDVDAAGVSTVIFESEKPQQSGQLLAPQKQQFHMLGRQWVLEAGLKPGFVAQKHMVQPYWLFGLGGLVSLLAACLIEVWNRAYNQKQALDKEQAQLAAIVSSSSDAIIGKSLDGVITSWNTGAATLFGYTATEAIGQKLLDLIIPAGLKHQEQHILSAISRGEHLTNFETQRQHKDGHIIEVSVNISPILDADNRVVGASKTVRDISVQKDHEQHILVMNVMLEKQVAERTEALEEARSTLQAVLDAVPSVIAYSNRDMIYQFANKAFQDWFGRDPDTVPGTHILHMIGQSAFGTCMPYINAALAGEIQVFECAIPLPDGQGKRHALVHLRPDTEQGQVRGFYVMMYDISEVTNKRLELASALRENEALLSTINKKMLSSVTSANGVILSVNDNFCHTSGYTQKELVGQGHEILNSGVHPPSMWKAFWSTLSQGQSWKGEICNRSKDGRLFWLDAVISPFLDAYGNVDRYVALYTDITQKKEADEEIKRLNVLFGNVLKASSEVAIIATDVDGLITIFNTGAERMLGYNADEMVGKTSPAILHVQEEVIARGEELSVEFGQPISGFRTFVHKPELEGAEVREWTYVGKSGSHLTVSLAVTAIFDDRRQLAGYLGVAIDVTQQRAQQRQLAFASEQLAKAAKVADLGVWSWTVADNRLEWNERMFDMYQQPVALKAKGLNYEHWRSRVHQDDVEAAEASLQDALAGRSIYDVEFRLRQLNGHIQYIHAAGLVERDEHGKATRMTGINRDITAQRELETQLRLAKKNADDASASKSRFLANMSHEIRTPMNAVLGMLQLIQQTQLNSRQQDYIVKAHTAAKSLLGLLNDILDFSKIDAGKLELDLHPFEFEGLMRDLGVILSGNQGNKNVEVMFDLPPDLPSVLIGDRLRIQQVLINLAGNALKFTQEGHVIVSVKLLANEDDNVNIRIAISDTGIGISKEQLNRIFEGFVQAEASTTRRFGGSGLGLVISKRLIDLMGGELHVNSVPGEGSSFYFDLCLSIDKKQSSAPEAIKVLQDMRVLVVDDNLVVADILMQTIAALGWQAELAHDGVQAVQMCDAANANNTPYTLILMDWRMPELDGIEAAIQINKGTSAPKVPVVLMVSANDSEHILEEQGDNNRPYYDLLIKPLTPKQLLQTAQRALSGAPRTTSASQEATLTRKQRLRGLHLLVVEDNALNRQVAFELLSSEGAIVELAEGGAEGVARVIEMQQAYDLLIMDVQMPDMDGHEATRRIRADGRFAALPVLAATADASPADRDACLAAGMNGHISKPIDLEEIVPAILELLGHKHSAALLRNEPALTPAKPDSTKPPVTQAATPEVEDLAVTLDRFANHFSMYLSIFEIFEPEAQRWLGELESSLENEQHASARIALHSLKGISSTVGASGLSRFAAELEDKLKAQPETPLLNLLSKDTIDELRTLFESSLAALSAAINAREQSVTEVASVTSLPEAMTAPLAATVSHIGSDIKQELAALLPLVKSNNLSVIDKLEALFDTCSEADKQAFRLLMKQINTLDFSSAAETMRNLLNN